MYKLITPPQSLPVSLLEIKEHLRVDSDDEDATLLAMIKAATVRTQAELLRPLVLQKYRLKLDEFAKVICLERPPVISVDRIQYVDPAGVTQTLAASSYLVDLTSEPARIVPALNQSWPATAPIPGAVIIEFSAGYVIPFTVSADDDELTTPGYSPADDDLLQLTNRGGTLPAGLSEGIEYYVVSASGGTFGLSLTAGGSPIDITDTGSGSHFVGELPAPIIEAIKLLVHHLYWNRDSESPGDDWMLYRTLLDDERWAR